MPSGIYLRTKEHKKKISESLKGRVFTDSWKKKISLSHIGSKHPNYGKHASLETRLKMSEAMKGTKFSDEHNWKISLARKGMKFTDKHKENLSKSLKLSHPKEYYKRIGLIGVQKQQSSKEPTSIEKKVYNELKAQGVLFERQKLINGKFLVDAYIPSLNLIIEADGDYWHSLPRVMKKDKAENAYLKKCGYNLLRLPEHEINDGSFKERMVF